MFQVEAVIKKSVGNYRTTLHHVQGILFSYFSGIAVSGGVDSMALARLCRELNVMPVDCKPKAAKEYVFWFRAFVVDHKAREGSSMEAQLTAERLEILGLLVL